MSYLKQVAAAAASNSTVQVLSVASGLALAHVLGPEGRGQYAAVTAWSGTLSLVGGLGIGASICYYVARSSAPRAVVTTALRLLVPASAAAALVGLALSGWLAGDDGLLRAAYVVGFASLPITIVGGVWVFALQGRDLSTWSKVRVVQPAAFAAILGVLYLVGRIDVVTSIAAVAASTLMGTIWSLLLWRSKASGPRRAVKRLLLPMTTFGLKNLAAQAPYLINSRVDQLILSLTVPLADLGLYAVSVSLTMLVFPLTAAFGHVAFPTIARLELTEGESARATVRQAVIGTVVIGTAGSLLVMATVPSMVPFLLGDGYRDVTPLVLVLAPGAVFLGLNQVLGDVLRAFDQALRVAKAELVAAGLTLVLLSILVPALGVVGAAISSTCSYILASGLLAVAVHKHLTSDSHPGLAVVNNDAGAVGQEHPQADRFR